MNKLFSFLLILLRIEKFNKIYRVHMPIASKNIRKNKKLRETLKNQGLRRFEEI